MREISFQLKSPMNAPVAFSYFSTAAPGIRCAEQNGLPQLPPQVASALGLVCNCRAETVPAQRTAAAIAARNVFLAAFRLPATGRTWLIQSGYFAAWLQLTGTCLS